MFRQLLAPSQRFNRTQILLQPPISQSSFLPLTRCAFLSRVVFCVVVDEQAPKALTDETARANLEKHGHPDGPQGTQAPRTHTFKTQSSLSQA